MAIVTLPIRQGPFGSAETGVTTAGAVGMLPEEGASGDLEDAGAGPCTQAPAGASGNLPG